MMEGSMVGSAIVELRQYQHVAGKRDDLIALFEREFIEEQERLGMVILGQFRDLDDPDRFVWLRGFPDMVRRAEALHAFYTGPAWRAYSGRANATMVSVDNVLLLRPADAYAGVPTPATPRPPIGY